MGVFLFKSKQNRIQCFLIVFLFVFPIFAFSQVKLVTYNTSLVLPYDTHDISVQLSDCLKDATICMRVRTNPIPPKLFCFYAPAERVEIDDLRGIIAGECTNIREKPNICDLEYALIF